MIRTRRASVWSANGRLRGDPPCLLRKILWPPRRLRRPAIEALRPYLSPHSTIQFFIFVISPL